MESTEGSSVSLSSLEIFSDGDQPTPSTAVSMIGKKSTALVYHESMKLHKCEWDPNYPECPDRITCIMDKLRELGLIEKCKNLVISEFGLEYILRVHTEKHTILLENICKNPKSHAEEAQKYDAIYFNKDTYQCALKAVNATLTLMHEIAVGKVKNGLAVIRPPGHHAQKENFNGYCFFNNVCIATEYLLKHEFKKILIVDVDVHHGQGTQRKYYDNKNVLYFSIHRYEDGTFWPCLEESNFNFIGEGEGVGYNINVPLNCIKCNDADYMNIVTHLLLPVAYEFNPDFILISGGYDACIGCPEGQMEVSPGFYGHLVMLLSGLAEGRLAVLLEGGYFLPSLASGVAMTLRGLLDMNPPILKELCEVQPQVAEVINNVKLMLRNNWECFGAIEFFDGSEIDTDFMHRVIIKKFKGEELEPPFEISDCYPKQDKYDSYKEIIDYLFKTKYGPPVEHKVYGYSFKKEFFKDYENRIVPVKYDDTPYFPSLLNEVQNRMIENPSTGLFVYNTSDTSNSKLFYSSRKACLYFRTKHNLKKILFLNFTDFWPVFKSFGWNKVLEFHFNKLTCFSRTQIAINTTDFSSDADYIHLFLKLILPVSYAFVPEAIVICISSQQLQKFKSFSHLVHLLKPLAGGRMLLLMDESKETLDTLAALLGEPLPKPDAVLTKGTQEVLHDMVSAVKKYWPILNIDRSCDSRVIYQD